MTKSLPLPFFYCHRQLNVTLAENRIIGIGIGIQFSVLSRSNAPLGLPCDYYQNFMIDTGVINRSQRPQTSSKCRLKFGPFDH